MAPASKGPTVAVFASQRGPGDPERSSIMSQAGSYFARHGARIACLVDGTAVPVPLIVKGMWSEPRIYPDIPNILTNPEGGFARLQDAPAVEGN